MGAPQSTREHGFDRDRLAERAAQQIGHAGNQSVGFDRLWIERLPTGEGEQLVRQRSRPSNAALRQLHRA